MSPPDGDWRRRWIWAGAILVVAGGFFFLSNLGLLDWWKWDVFWPVVLIALGLLIVLHRVRPRVWPTGRYAPSTQSTAAPTAGQGHGRGAMSERKKNPFGTPVQPRSALRGDQAVKGLARWAWAEIVAMNPHPGWMREEGLEGTVLVEPPRAPRPERGARQPPFTPRLLLAAFALVLVTGAGLGLVSQHQRVDQLRNANQLLASQMAEQQGQVAALEAEVKDLKERWFGSPAVWQPPAIANADIEFFDVSGSTQRDLIKSLNNASICSKFGPCLPDPAVPSGAAWGLEGRSPGSFNTAYCYSPGTTTDSFRTYVLLPRWSPSADGSVKISLVKAWNSLAQAIYTHEAGHVAIDIKDIAALNDQAHHLPSCQALINFWANPSVFDKLNADQNAYHARLRADCRPEIGCIPSGWLGWG